MRQKTQNLSFKFFIHLSVKIENYATLDSYTKTTNSVVSDTFAYSSTTRQDGVENRDKVYYETIIIAVIKAWVKWV